jgi:hypothetical protein
MVKVDEVKEVEKVSTLAIRRASPRNSKVKGVGVVVIDLL